MTRTDPYSIHLLGAGRDDDPITRLRTETADFLAGACAVSSDPTAATVAFMQVQLAAAAPEVRSTLAEAAALRTRWSRLLPHPDTEHQS